jgi:hypothetical protein
MKSTALDSAQHALSKRTVVFRDSTKVHAKKCYSSFQYIAK